MNSGTVKHSEDTSVVSPCTNTIHLCGHNCFDPERGGNDQLVQELNATPTVLQQDGDQAVTIAGKEFRVRFVGGCLRDCKNGPRILVDVDEKMFRVRAACLADLQSIIPTLRNGHVESEPEDEV